ncbi:MAG: thiamine pyrophosphate-dependent enzyme [Burkholderiales bacterium]
MVWFDFLIGLPFAVGLSLAFPKRKVLAIDGDGSLIIETSSLITAADVSPPNLVVVFDNGNYTEMGETATSRRTDLEIMAKGAGMQHTVTVRTLADFEREAKAAFAGNSMKFIVAKVEHDEKIPFVGNYIRRSERGMKESFVDALKQLPDYPGKR